MNWKQRALARLMTDISETVWHAGWMSHNEYMLWQLVVDPGSASQYLVNCVPQRQVSDLCEISQEIGGWIMWVDAEHVLSEDDDLTFVPFDQWLPRFEAFAKKNVARSARINADLVLAGAMQTRLDAIGTHGCKASVSTLQPSSLIR